MRKHVLRVGLAYLRARAFDLLLSLCAVENDLGIRQPVAPVSHVPFPAVYCDRI